MTRPTYAQAVAAARVTIVDGRPTPLQKAIIGLQFASLSRRRKPLDNLATDDRPRRGRR